MEKIDEKECQLDTNLSGQILRWELCCFITRYLGKDKLQVQKVSAPSMMFAFQKIGCGSRPTLAYKINIIFFD